MLPHSCRILQKCTIFEGSNTHGIFEESEQHNFKVLCSNDPAGVDVKAPKFWQLVSKVMQLKEYQETELSCNQNTKPVVEGKMLKALDIVEPLYWRKNTLQLMPQASLCHLYVQHLFAASFGKLETMIPGLFTSRPLKLKYVCEASCPLTLQLILGQVCILHLHYLLSDLWSLLEDGTSFLRVHPKFLHSNATSHKWAFGAIAELLDNAVDEIQNGATYAIIDKMLNPKDGTSALLIQDDGGGMDQEAMQCCLSFGFSDKKSKSAIGQYGNGFKTSSMRLGADVVVFSRCMKNRKLMQSVGLLSFTFLTRAGLDRIVVPMIEYEFMSATSKWTSICSEQHFVNNLSLLLQWSPFSTEEELLKQFDSIGDHGTKIIIYNLWLNDEGEMELDFYSDPEDIRISCDAESGKSCSRMSVSDLHLANTLRYSLRAYLSILYLRIPENFCIWLCGQIVEYHNIANDLKYREFILYKPQNGGCEEGSVITSIGFLKEAPLVNIHGFNVYHRNRLILPFWHVVVGFSVNRSRGVVGVLEANFIKPTHNKQDFEKTPLFHKLEHRLKEMTWEYWDHHCGLIGYHATKQLHAPSQDSLQSRKKHATAKRKNCDHQIEPEILKQKAGSSVNLPDPESIQNPPATTLTSPLEDQEMVLLLKENKRLHARCLEIEKKEEEFNAKIALLRKELKEEQRKYGRLLVQSAVLENSKREHTIIIV